MKNLSRLDILVRIAKKCTKSANFGIDFAGFGKKTKEIVEKLRIIRIFALKN